SYRAAIIQTAASIAGKAFTEAEVEQLKMLPNSNNDWDVAYALAIGVRDLGSIDRTGPEYAMVREKFQELYLGGLRDLEKLLVDKELLQTLRVKGYRLGIVTGRPRAEALYALNRLIPNFFPPDSIIAMEDCPEGKPSPKPLLLAKERLGCRSALYVGDTINDALAAKAAGMRFVSVAPDVDSDFTIQNVNRILEVLA
ncbi:TPA: HAD family hydrolase, partial [Candidatus Micrarchaeota archaeon]|nr:HAD family hydrolase [Candidatus Micrarchaeota archaeon]